MTKGKKHMDGTKRCRIQSGIGNGSSGGTGSAVSEERGFAGVGESLDAARDPVKAGQAEDGVLSCWRSANPNDETERQLPGPQRRLRRYGTELQRVRSGQRKCNFGDLNAPPTTMLHLTYR